MEAIPLAKRREVLADCDAGMGTLAADIMHQVSESWIRRLKQRRRETGEFAARPPIKKSPPRWRSYAERMQLIVKSRPDVTLRELRDELGVDFSLQMLSLALRTLMYTFKKVLHAAEQDWPDVAARRVPAPASRLRHQPSRISR